LEEEDLFCANCGTENKAATQQAEQESSASKRDKVASTQIASVYAFECEGCGASMSYDASAQALRCPFCGSTALHERKDARTLRAEAVIPLSITRDVVDKALRHWLSQGFWRPNDTATESVIASATAVYVPFWVFTASTHTYWTGDESAPFGSRADWRGTSGEHQGSHSAILIQASSVLGVHEVDAIMPFNLQQLVDPENVDLKNITVEDFRVPRRDARMMARSKIEAVELQQCRQYLRGRGRNVHVNVMISNMQGSTLLAPVWIMVYHYQNKPYRVLINGQTGKTNGSAPISIAKVSAAIGLVVLVIIAIVLITLFSKIAR
jgi:predicted RNA-binding Zn-ribbon protein involved in translation (DUF1610 family)